MTAGPAATAAAPRAELDLLHARASLVATEFSLIGLGACLLMATTLAAMAHSAAAIAVGRQAVAVGAGLLSFGVIAVGAGHGLDAGGCRTASAGMRRLFWPVAVLATLAAAAAWASFWLPWSAGTPRPAAGTWAVAASSFVFGIPLLAGLCLRSVAAPHDGAPAPLVLLLQASSHTLTGGTVLLLVLCSLNDQLTASGRHYITAAVCTLSAHALVWAGWLLRETRQMVRRLRQSQTRLPGLVRCHRIASAATVGGLMVPGLLLFHALVTGKELGVLVACALLGASNHALRYAWVLTSWQKRRIAAA